MSLECFSVSNGSSVPDASTSAIIWVICHASATPMARVKGPAHPSPRPHTNLPVLQLEECWSEIVIPNN